MPASSSALRGAWLTAACLLALGACQRLPPGQILASPAANPKVAPVTPANPGTPPATDPDGCNPQLPAAWRIAQLPQATSTTLEIHVFDTAGAPAAGVDVRAIRQLPSGFRCPSQVDAQTGVDGVARIERLKPGPYKVLIIGDNGSASDLTLEAGVAMRARLVKR